MNNLQSFPASSSLSSESTNPPISSQDNNNCANSLVVADPSPKKSSQPRRKQKSPRKKVSRKSNQESFGSSVDLKPRPRPSFQPRIVPATKPVNESIETDLDALRPKCTKCSIVFKTDGELKHHNKIHDDLWSKYSCRVCFRRFQSWHRLVDHLWFSHYDIQEDIKFHCPVCPGRKYQFRRQLVYHFERYHPQELENTVRLIYDFIPLNINCATFMYFYCCSFFFLNYSTFWERLSPKGRNKPKAK